MSSENKTIVIGGIGVLNINDNPPTTLIAAGCPTCGSVFSCNCSTSVSFYVFRNCYDGDLSKLEINDKRKLFRKIGNKKQTRWN